MLREVGALIAEGQTDTAEDRIVSRRDGITECGATEHHVGRRLSERTTRTGAVLFPTPFDKFGHGGKLPCHEADAGLNSTWGQIQEGAAEHVPRVVPATQKVRSVGREGACAAIRSKLLAPGLPKGNRRKGQQTRRAGVSGTCRER